VIKF
jgi:hypothetical protein